MKASNMSIREQLMKGNVKFTVKGITTYRKGENDEFGEWAGKMNISQFRYFKGSKRLVRILERINMKINNFNAVGIAEGFIECNDEEKIIEAWQYLIDTGLAFKLQGWFGRTAIDLIEQGICQNKQASEQKG